MPLFSLAPWPGCCPPSALPANPPLRRFGPCDRRIAGIWPQVEVAKRLGVGQAAVSRMENRADMLLSTLYDYLTATATGAGADAASIVVVVHGQRIELDLGSLRTRPEAATR